MSLQQTPEPAVLDSLTTLFQEHGFDGASLSRIVKATGLVKASLYHRFARGKQEMATAVIEHVSHIFAAQLLAPLTGPGKPEERLRETSARISKFYGSGAKACLLDTLTLNSANRKLRRRSSPPLNYWIEAFAKFAQECGLPPSLARERAEDAITAIEGSLVVARVTNNREPFRRAIKSLPNRLTRF